MTIVEITGGMLRAARSLIGLSQQVHSPCAVGVRDSCPMEQHRLLASKAQLTEEQTGAPAFAIPLRTSESWRPSVAG
jgi:hypothetical protein